MDRCPICKRDFDDCPHSLVEAQNQIKANRNQKIILKTLRHLEDHDVITKKDLIAVLRAL